MKRIFVLSLTVLIAAVVMAQVGKRNETISMQNLENRSLYDQVAERTFTEVNTVIGNETWGTSIKSAGDVNGDGFEDVIVSAAGDAANGNGKVLLYYGGVQLSDKPDLVFSRTYDSYGNSIEGIGDINGDGYDDIIVGVPTYVSSKGAAFIYFGGPNMDNQHDMTVQGEVTYSNFSYAMTGLGDINADGFDDFAVGAFSQSSNTGKVFLFYGSATPDGVADMVFTGESTNSRFGFTLASGRINNDTIPDLVIAATGMNTNKGRIYIYHGGQSMDNIADLTINGYNNNTYFGSAIECGDLNNDGADDIIVGSVYEGKAYVFYGGDLADNAADVTLSNPLPYEGFGRALSTGDINGDNVDDLVIGDSDYSNSWPGASYVYFGGGPVQQGQAVYGLTNYNYVGTAVALNGDASVVAFGGNHWNTLLGGGIVKVFENLGDTLIQRGNTFTAPYGHDLMGSALSLSGDGNILAIGIPANQFNTLKNGRVQVYSWDGSTWNQKGSTLSGDASADEFGISLELTPDASRMVIGARGHDGNGTNSGAVRVFEWSGSDWVQLGADIAGEAVSDMAGCGVSISADGTTVAIGAKDNDGGGTSSGHCRVFEWNGSAWMQKGTDIDGQAGEQLGRSVHLNSNGNKLIVGANASSLYGTFAGAARVYEWNGSTWQQQGSDLYMTDADSHFGFSVDMTDDGNTISASAAGDFTIAEYGAERLFKYTWNGSAWVQACELITPDQYSGRGYSARMSSNGDYVAVGFPLGTLGGVGLTGYGKLFDWSGISFDTIPDLIMKGSYQKHNFGASVCLGSDYNNDGADDLFVGAPSWNSDFAWGSTGAFYVYDGGTAVDTIHEYRVTGPGTRARYGEYLSVEGDVNNDGYNDMAFLAPHYNVYTENVGKLYIYFGGPDPDSIADVIIQADTIDGSIGGNFEMFDYNGDNYDDIIIYSSKGINIYYGGTAMDGIKDMVIKKPYANIYAFGEVNDAGDVNNDGYLDLLVKTYQTADTITFDTVKLFLYHGGPLADTIPDAVLTGDYADGWASAFASAGDINGDGYDDVIVSANVLEQVSIYYGGAPMDNTPDRVFNPEQASSQYGRSVDGIGDLNQDGYDDIVIGAPAAGTNYQGAFYIYYGGANMDYTYDAGGAGYYYGEQLGTFVYGAGDVNGDGLVDVITSNGAYNSAQGKMVIYLGTIGALGDTIVTYSEEFFGEYTNQWYGNTASAGDVNNDGVNDIITAAYWGGPEFGYNGRGYLYFGVQEIQIVESPLPQNGCEGDTLTLTVSTDITPNAYRWYYQTNTGLLTAASNSSWFAGVTTNTLTLKNIGVGSGLAYMNRNYYCKVTSPTGFFTWAGPAYIGLDTGTVVFDSLSLPMIQENCSVIVSDIPTATSSCSGSIMGETSDPLTYDVPGSYQITWIYVSAQGDTLEQIQEVIVTDDLGPVPDLSSLPDVVAECDVTLSAPVATDDCMGAITANTSDDLYYDLQGSYIVNWTYYDGNGNSVIQQQNVIIADTSDAVLDVAIADVFAECEANLTAPTATDGCTGSLFATTSDPVSYTDQGSYTVTWTFDDGNGNVFSEIQNVTVLDDQAPVASCPDSLVVYTEQGTAYYTITSSELDVTATDNCQLASVSNSLNLSATLDGVILSLGQQDIVWTFTDAVGNVAQCSTMIVVNQYTGVNALQSEPVVIYPNPASDVIYISNAQNQTVRIYNALGMEVMRKEITSELTELPVGGLSRGIYHVRVGDVDFKVVLTN